jgi:chemotaxis protein histidine kinase CheA
LPAEPDLKRLIRNFAGEAKELCEKAARELLTLERPPDQPEAVSQSRENLVRHLHTLKGSGATLGLEDVVALAHRLETLAEGGDPSAAMPAALVDLSLRALDQCLARVRAHAAGEGGSLGPPDELVAALDAALARPAEALAAAASTAAPASPSLPPSPPPARAADPSEPDEESWRVSHAHLAALVGEADRLREIRLRLFERRREVRSALDALELRTPTKVELQALLERLEQSLAQGCDDADQAADGLDEALKGISTLPVSTILEPLQRTVRDAARITGKAVTLSAVGGELLVDRRILDSLRAPLIHLVRNGVDHGIEPPEDRLRAGKASYGAVVIRAELRGHQLVLEVSDDGRGLDHAAIRQAALERGMAPAALDVLPPEGVEQLIFRPGFSTRAEASELSGRGVGLDVVATQVRQLGGTVSVKSAAGQGSQFLITVPTRTGNAPVLPLGAGDVLVGLPVAAVESISRVGQSALHRALGGVHLEKDGELVPVQDLGGLLRIRHPVVVEEQTLVVARHGGARFGLVVDEVKEHQDLAIRTLPLEVRSLAAYQGLAMLAGGALMPVLDPAWVLGAVAGKHEAARPAAAERRALVVDDSLTARALHRSILEASGYSVHVAATGPQALEHLHRAPYDVLICDLSMAGMDGLALTRAVRASDRGRDVPVIVVSASESDRARESALAAGADAFLSKRECAAGRLASEVAAVIARRKALS